jgi:hypothetical protein
MMVTAAITLKLTEANNTLFEAHGEEAGRLIEKR